MALLTVRVVGIQEDTGIEYVLASVEANHYDPDALDSLITIALMNSLVKLKTTGLDSIRPWLPEVSIVVTADDEAVRPSLHLSQDTLRQLAEAGAELDFDPYV